MKRRYLTLKNWLLATLLGAFGLGACHSAKPAAATTPTPPPDDDPVTEQPKPRDPVVLMYGVPTMNFVVQGRVVDEQGQPVKGMQVVLLNRNVDLTPDNMQDDNPYAQEYIRNSSDTTDADGRYRVSTTDTPASRGQLIVRDIDGPRNGSYRSQLLDIHYDSDHAQGAGGWNRGTVETTEDIVVEKQ